MKKLLSAYIFCFIVITTGICSASVPDEQVALGGISYQSSSSYVKSIYGEPDRVTSTNNDPLYKTVEKYYYGNSFLVEFSNSKAVWISIVFCQVKIPEMSVRIPSFCTGNFPVLSGMGRADQETATFCRINACSIR